MDQILQQPPPLVVDMGMEPNDVRRSSFGLALTRITVVIPADVYRGVMEMSISASLHLGPTQARLSYLQGVTRAYNHWMITMVLGREGEKISLTDVYWRNIQFKKYMTDIVQKAIPHPRHPLPPNASPPPSTLPMEPIKPLIIACVEE